MSESTTSAPAVAPAPVADVAPPPSSQQSISISEAGRLLRQQRRNGAEGGDSTPAAPSHHPSANEAAQQAREAAQKAINSGDKAINSGDKATNATQTGLSAMERALGVPGTAPPEGTPPLQQTTTPTDGSFGELVIEGQRLRSLEDVRAFAERKSADYTQKTQALSQQAQQLQAQQRALADVLPYIQPELQRLAESLQRAEQAQRPDPSLAHTDPTRYVQEHAAWEAAVAEHNRLGGLTTLQQQAHERAMAAQVAQAHEQLAAEFPFWNNPEERLQAQQQIKDWALSKGGFTMQELSNLADARHFKLMMKARAFDHWMEGARTTAPAAQLAAPPRGTPPPAPPTARVQEQQQRFEQKPDWRNGAALLGAMRAAATRR